MSTDAHVEAWKTRLAPVVKAPVYDLDEVRTLANLPPYYLVLYLSRRFSDESLRMDGFRDPTAYRLSTRYVSKTVTNARLLLDRVRTNIEGSTITVDSRTSTPVTFETEDALGEDDEGYFTGLDDWTFVL